MRGCFAGGASRFLFQGKVVFSFDPSNSTIILKKIGKMMLLKTLARAAAVACLAAAPFSGLQAEPIALEGVEWNGDPEKGAKVAKKCFVCHVVGSNGKGRIGPNLTGVFGRTSGTLEGYKYSKAMKEAAVVWSASTLDAFLTQPRKFVPKTKMSFPGVKNEQQRHDLIAFLLRES